MDFGTIKQVSGYAESSLNILSGIGALASAGDIGREKKKLLKFRADTNRKRIQESFEKNYSIQMSKYANDLSDISIQRTQAENAILTQATQNIGAIDIQGSSYKDIATATLNNEFSSEMNKLIDNHINNNLSLANKAIELERDVNIAQAQGNLQIDQETANAKTKAIGQIIDGMTGGMNRFMTKKAEEESKQDTYDSIENFDSKLKTPDYSDKYFTSQVNTWVSATKNKNQGMDPIAYMLGKGGK